MGVDVFFVISGFLIGGIILRELDSGDFSFRRFWERRIRRIVPAILFFLAVTLFVGWRILPAPDLSSLAAQTFAALFGVANFKMLALTGGYWAAPANSILLLHTWSLAVEEQFYVLMPFILALAYRWFRRQIPLLLVAFLSASLALSLYWGTNVYPGNFFLLPSRAWELLLGCLGAWALKERLALPRSLASPAAGLGLVALLFSAFFFHLNESWPDARTLLPAVATLLVLISPAAAGAVSLPVQFLSLPPVRFIGLISYSLYLWHWPMIVFLREFGPDEITLTDRWLLVAVSVALAALSWRFVEQPFRQKLPSRRISTRLLLIGAGAVWLCLAVVSGQIAKTPVRQLSSPSARPSLFNSPGLESIQKYDAAGREAAGGIKLSDATGSPQCVLLGSSLGMMLGPAIESLSAAYHTPCVLFCRSGMSPLFSGDPATNHIARKLRELRLRDEAVKKYVAQWKPKVVILAARWNKELDGRVVFPDSFPTSFVQESSNTLRWLGQHASRVVVVGQVPQLPLENGEDARDAIWKRYRRQGNVMPRLLEHPDITAQRRLALKIFQNCRITNLFIIDPDALFHNPNQSLRYYTTNGILYFDDHHLNSLGSMELKPLFEPVFQSIAP